MDRATTPGTTATPSEVLLGAQASCLLRKAAINTGSAQWVKAGLSLTEAAVNVGFEDDPGQTAWLLIHRALTRALAALVEEQKVRLLPESEKLFDQLADKIDLSLEESEIHIDASLFERPGELSLLSDVRKALEEWLIGAGLEEARAVSVSGRLKQYFVLGLAEEWSSSIKLYRLIGDHMASPFADAVDRSFAWQSYGSWLERQVDEPVSDEVFSLQPSAFVRSTSHCGPTRSRSTRKRSDMGQLRTGRRFATSSACSPHCSTG